MGDASVAGVGNVGMGMNSMINTGNGTAMRGWRGSIVGEIAELGAFATSPAQTRQWRGSIVGEIGEDGVYKDTQELEAGGSAGVEPGDLGESWTDANAVWENEAGNGAGASVQVNEGWLKLEDVLHV